MPNTPAPRKNAARDQFFSDVMEHAQTNALHAQLISAAKDGAPNSVIQALLEQGADPSYFDFDGQNALHVAIMNKNERLVRLLAPFSPMQVMEEATYPGAPLLFAAQTQWILGVEILAPFSDLNQWASYDRTALMIAAENQNAAMIEMLLPASDIFLISATGRGAIAHATDGCAPDCMRLLLDAARARDIDQLGEHASAALLGIAPRALAELTPEGCRGFDLLARAANPDKIIAPRLLSHILTALNAKSPTAPLASVLRILRPQFQARPQPLMSAIKLVLSNGWHAAADLLGMELPSEHPAVAQMLASDTERENLFPECAARQEALILAAEAGLGERGAAKRASPLQPLTAPLDAKGNALPTGADSRGSPRL